MIVCTCWHALGLVYLACALPLVWDWWWNGRSER